MTDADRVKMTLTGKEAALVAMILREWPAESAMTADLAARFGAYAMLAKIIDLYTDKNRTK